MKKFRLAFWAVLVALALSSVVTVSAQLTGPTVSGRVTLDGSNPSSAQTGLKTLTSCIVTLNTAVAPGLKYTLFTVQFTPTAGRIDIYAWKPTSSSVTTLVASTDTGEQVNYICTGTTN